MMKQRTKDIIAAIELMIIGTVFIRETVHCVLEGRWFSVVILFFMTVMIVFSLFNLWKHRRQESENTKNYRARLLIKGKNGDWESCRNTSVTFEENGIRTKLIVDIPYHSVLKIKYGAAFRITNESECALEDDIELGNKKCSMYNSGHCTGRWI